MCVGSNCAVLTEFLADIDSGCHSQPLTLGAPIEVREHQGLHGSWLLQSVCVNRELMGSGLQINAELAEGEQMHRP